MPENLVSRDGFSRPVPRQPAHLHTQAELVLTYGIAPEFRGGVHMKPPYAIGSVPSLSGHAIAYRWRSLPRVRRHRASKPQGSFERVLPWQITMDQLIFASLSHTHYWYEVGMLKVEGGMLKVPAVHISRWYNSRISRVTAAITRMVPLKAKFGNFRHYNQNLQNSGALTVCSVPV